MCNGNNSAGTKQYNQTGGSNQAHLQALLKAQLQATAPNSQQQRSEPVNDTLKQQLAKALLAQGIPVNMSPPNEQMFERIQENEQCTEQQQQQQKFASLMQPIRVMTQTPSSGQWSNPSTPNSMGDPESNHNAELANKVRLQSLLMQQQQKMLAQKYSPRAQHSPVPVPTGLDKRFPGGNGTPPRGMQQYPRQRNTSEQSNESYHSSSSSERLNQQSITEFNLERYGLLQPGNKVYQDGRSGEHAPQPHPHHQQQVPAGHPMDMHAPMLPQHLAAATAANGGKFPLNMMAAAAAAQLQQQQQQHGMGGHAARW